ncbi:3-keto-5-aminohexanoate cleavage protein [Acidaminobacter sp. JC074]|uniref:3-keto-5-aminohexanoate cleavage protein n=1 Tax=Acidaminobacter sp. JC074 TaxID=2530199 RepID=UPI001F0D2A11|nr:3-keto-5-aminohexanoate cleavage protein [Acidaminobacter sp. JC074]MCH4891257.1 3-keto-5-aminohexanoate cleavage protein [Acidaminobacter sp. JC074]
MDKLIITVAPTGNVPTKALNPNAPITNEEIVKDVLACEALGASIAHLHIRDENEQPTSDRLIYKDLLDKLKKSGTNIITQLSTGARGGKNTIDYRSQMLDLNCEMASLSTGSSNFPTSINGNSPELIEALASKMLQNNIKPEIEVFDTAMIKNANYLVKKGIIKPNLHFNLVMNVPGSMAGTPRNLMFLVESLPQNSTFTVSGIGKSQIQMLTMAILLGGHVRTGLEDVLKMDQDHASNTELVKQVIEIARAVKRPIANPDQAREILSL